MLRDGRRIATTPASELTVSDLIVQMLGEAPHRLTAARPPDSRPGDELRIEHLRVPGRLTDFSLTAQAGRVYALAGQLGSGASDVLRALAGLHPQATGSGAAPRSRRAVPQPRRRAGAGVAFVSNDRKSEGLFLDKPVAANLPRHPAALPRPGRPAQLPP